MDKMNIAETKTVAMYDKQKAIDYMNEVMVEKQMVAVELTIEEMEMQDNRSDRNLYLYKVTSYYDLTKQKE